MKTTAIIKIMIVLCMTSLKFSASKPSGTYTSNPCQPTGNIVSIANTYGCFSFSVNNPSSDPNGFYTWDFGDGTNITAGNYLYHCYSSCTVTTIYTVTLYYNNAAILCGIAPMQQSYTLA